MLWVELSFCQLLEILSDSIRYRYVNIPVASIACFADSQEEAGFLNLAYSRLGLGCIIGAKILIKMIQNLEIHGNPGFTKNAIVFFWWDLQKRLVTFCVKDFMPGRPVSWSPSSSSVACHLLPWTVGKCHWCPDHLAFERLHPLHGCRATEHRRGEGGGCGIGSWSQGIQISHFTGWPIGKHKETTVYCTRFCSTICHAQSIYTVIIIYYNIYV